ncbi:MAG: putative metalloprotease CJM1_0395 family protein [Chromatiales bacterium]|jgi:hypothetical protein|nr:putative metalloprotease CJM1_0395 family protein [Chromatiales bacterium]MDX9768298.1 putative metalloprotease CJM1_0395 family protein [Ectothiorhodospiraceae bacterium]
MIVTPPIAFPAFTPTERRPGPDRPGGGGSVLPSEILRPLDDPEQAAPRGKTEEDPTKEREDAARTQELKDRDAQVRAHERAHVMAGGSLVRGGANFTYEKGPDGQMYAVGGEVKIDTSSERTPEETLDKAERIIQAAMAPVDPSPQDRAVAAQAAQMAAQARVDVARQQAEEGSAGQNDEEETFLPRFENADGLRSRIDGIVGSLATERENAMDLVA